MILPDMNTELLDEIYNNKWLTPHEKRVLELRYHEGLYNYQIAMEMNCSTRTVERTLRRILNKTAPIISEYNQKI